MFGAAYVPVAKRKPGRPPNPSKAAEALVSPPAGDIVSSTDTAEALVSPPAEASASSTATSSTSQVVSTAAGADTAGALVSPPTGAIVSSTDAAGALVSSAAVLPGLPSPRTHLVKKRTKQSAKKLQQERKDAKRKSMRERVQKLEQQVSFLMQEVSELRGKPKDPEHQEEQEEEQEDGPKHATKEYFQAMGARGGRKRVRSFEAKMPFTATPCKHLRQPPLSAKVALGRYMRKVVKQEFGGKATERFWAGMVNDVGKPKPWLSDVYENLEELDKQRIQCNLGMGVQTTKLRQGDRTPRGMGKRGMGGGRKNWLTPIWLGVKRWFMAQRDNGCFVDKHDLFLELSERTIIFADKLEAYRAAGKPLSRADHRALSAAKQFMISTNSEHKHFVKNRQNRTLRLMRFIGCRLCKPQRLVDLSKDEEMHRLHQTWKLIDERLSLVAFGTEDELSGHVGDVASFMEHRKQCVVLQSDQMPVYALLKPSHQLYAAHERRKPGSKSEHSLQAKQGNLSGGHGTASMHPLDELEQAKPGSTSQKRGTDHVGQDKHRVTVELVHAIFHWFDESKRPVSKQGKHLLVMCGQHADLSNIDDEHCFISTKRFWAQGKPMEHIEGEKTTLMHNLVKLRKNEPSVREMCSKLHIMQQPSGFVDQTLRAWHTEHQSEQYL